MLGREPGVRWKRRETCALEGVNDQERRLNQASASHESEICVVSQALQVSSEKPFRRDLGHVTGQQGEGSQHCAAG